MCRGSTTHSAAGIAYNLPLARSDTPVVLLSGPRQVGKSALARLAAQTSRDQPIRFAGGSLGGTPAAPSRYFTLDDATTLASVTADPEGWLLDRRSDDWIVIDEVQRLPELLVSIKREVDLDRRVKSLPLAQCEIGATDSTFLRRIFSTERPDWRGCERRAGASQRVVRLVRRDRRVA